MKILILFFLFHLSAISQILRTSDEENAVLVKEFISSTILFAEISPFNCPNVVHQFRAVFLAKQEEHHNPSIAVTCKDLANFQNTLSGLETSLKSHYRTHTSLKNLNFVLTDSLNNAVFNHTSTAILMPKYFVQKEGKYRNPILTLPILVHEYGHYIVHTHYPVFDFNNYNTYDDETYFIMQAFHELLADIISVNYYQDPKVNSDALKSTFDQQFALDKDQVPYLIHSRDFSDRRNNLSSLMPLLKNGDRAMINGYLGAPHAFFAPTRKFLWDNFMSNPEIRQRIGIAAMSHYLLDEASSYFKTKVKTPKLYASQDHIQRFEEVNKSAMAWFDSGIKQKRYLQQIVKRPIGSIGGFQGSRNNQ